MLPFLAESLRREIHGVSAESARRGESSLQAVRGSLKRHWVRSAAAAALWLMSVSSAVAANPHGRTLEVQISRLQSQVEQLEAARSVKHLQRAYGYYTDRALWGEVADLFATDGTVELGADGVYAGRTRIREYLTR